MVLSMVFVVGPLIFACWLCLAKAERERTRLARELIRHVIALTRARDRAVAERDYWRTECLQDEEHAGDAVEDAWQSVELATPSDVDVWHRNTEDLTEDERAALDAAFTSAVRTIYPIPVVPGTDGYAPRHSTED
jgi:hypothetical protein